MSMSRRNFIKRAAIAGLAASVTVSGAAKASAALNSSDEYASIIDLTHCDGCRDVDIPRCVSACRTRNEDRFPQPEKPIQDYWPQTKHEDWSDKQDLTDRLTPYNWTYVQHLQVEHEGQTHAIHVPRRCLHCDNPPCASLCPFGVNEKMPQGPVIINPDGCFGGAKCRDVCPWEIPQRQAGVGLYLKAAPKYAGGGVMYKCDMCYDLIQQGQKPACVSVCPNNALGFGKKDDIRQYALQWARDNQGYLYGETENGGTSTFYLSSVPFAAIHQAIMEQETDGKPGKPGMPVGISNMLNEPAGMAKAFLLAPAAGLLGAGLSVYKIMTGADEHDYSEA
jgi:Fe-S-cluster-containing dehydrogenase component